MPQVILTPHLSGLGPRYWERAIALFSGNLRAWMSGKPRVNAVDKRAGYGFSSHPGVLRCNLGSLRLKRAPFPAD